MLRPASCRLPRFPCCVSARLLAVISFGLLFSGCAIRNADFATGFEPTAVRAVRLRPVAVDGDNAYHNSMFNDRMAVALTAAFEARGVVVGGDAPDAEVQWRLELEPGRGKLRSSDRQQIFWRHHYPGWPGVPERTWPVGMLIVDVMDADQTDKLLWRGWEEIILVQPTLTEKTVNSAVSSIMRGFK